MKHALVGLRAVIDCKEFETAERLLDTALNDFPASMELTQMRALLPSAVHSSPVSGALLWKPQN